MMAGLPSLQKKKAGYGVSGVNRGGGIELYIHLATHHPGNSQKAGAY